MKVSRRTRILLVCIADVMRARRYVAWALWDVRRSCRPAFSLRVARRYERWLAASMRTLELAWECCVRPAEGLT